MLQGKAFSHNHTVDMGDSRVCVKVSVHGVNYPTLCVATDNDMWGACCIKRNEIFTGSNRVGVGVGIVIEGEFLVKWPTSLQSQSEAKGYKTYCFQSIIDHNLRVGVNTNIYVAGQYIVNTAGLEGAGHD